ncbi:MAG: hypothetical protein J6A89_08235 [Clostridia bacterium]|nr:hypothetical protein [Clostridia bacterium]
MKKIIIEVGSTNTKIDKYDGKNIKNLGTETIEFKKNYKKENKLQEKDVEKLINLVNQSKKDADNIYVCGTSVFRDLNEKQKDEFLNRFKLNTGIQFEIISSQKENELTVAGATKKVNSKVAVFVGGGGSTEIAIYDNGIKEMVNTPIGVMDIMDKFPDLAENLATTNLEDVKKFIKERLNLPKYKADILILAGGAHKKFAIESGVRYEKNSLYEDELQPIQMDIETRINETQRYYKEISLDEIRNKSNNPNWWYGTRAMCAFVLVVAEEIGAKYVVPTDLSMVYGLI